MKCLYTEAELTMTGAQIIACAIDENGIPVSDNEKKIARNFPQAYGVVEQMFNSNMDEPPRLGDVIWSTQGGNKHIGFCVVKRDNDVSEQAVGSCMKSCQRKAKELQHEYIGMDLFGSNNSDDWNHIVDTIEDNLVAQAVVCIDTNEKLNEVLSNLKGGSKFKVILEE